MPIRGSLIILALAVGCGGRTTAQVTDSHPDALTQDSTNIYWTTREGEVFTRPKEGGTPSFITSARSYGFERGVWVDASNVYFIGVDDVTNRGALFVAPRTGGPPAALVDAVNIAVDASGVYWTEVDQTSSPPRGLLVRHRDSGGIISTLASAPSGPVWQLVLDDTHVYWADLRELVRVPKAGGSVSVLASARENREIVSVVVDDARAYLATCTASQCNDISVVSIGKNGGGP